MEAESARAKRATPEVALLVETSTSYGRDVLSGIALYVRENGPWSVRVCFMIISGLGSRKLVDQDP